MAEENDKKNKFALYIRDSSLDVARQWYKWDNCNSISEFIEKAVLFYGGYVANTLNPNYLPKATVSTIRSTLEESNERINRNLFKVAVELSILENIVATLNGISGIAIDKLRGDCVKEVKKLHGTMEVEQAVKWQES